MRKTIFENMKPKRHTSRSKERIASKPLSAIIQVMIIVLLILVLCSTFFMASCENAIVKPKWIRWSFFGFATILVVLQCWRIKCPLLLVDRVFANHPGKQIVLAFFVFIFTIDLAMCMFPQEGIRSSFVNIISYVKLSHMPKDNYRYDDNADPNYDWQDDYRVIKDPSPMSRWDYFKHGILYCLGLIVFNGLLIATITRVMATRAERYRKGENTYYRIGDHYVLIGYRASCVPIIHNISDRKGTDPSSYFIILSNQDTSMIRRSIATRFHNLSERIIIYSGDMNDKTHLDRLRIENAKEIFVLGEGESPGRDSLNLECAKALKELLCARSVKKKPPILQINVQFDRPSSYSTIKRITIPKQYYQDDQQREVTYLRPFNFYENWARLLWGNYQLDGYQTLDRSLMVEKDTKGNLKLSRKHVHLVIAGFNEMGIALLLEALRVCHYPNYDEETDANRTIITIVDPRMEDILPKFQSQYPYLSQIKDIHVEYMANRIEDKDIRDMLDRLSRDNSSILTIAICFNDPDNSLSAALSLPDSMYYSIIDGHPVHNESTQILVRQELKHGLSNLLDEEIGKYSNLKVFGTLDKGVDDHLLDDNMAMLIASYFHCKYLADNSFDFFHLAEHDLEKAIDLAKKNWHAMNEDKRFSNRYQVEMYKTYKAYRTLLDESPERLYQMEHLRWCAERSIMGYRDTHELGLKENTYLLHKLIVPYKDLPKAEKTKDADVLNNLDRVYALAQSM